MLTMNLEIGQQYDWYFYKYVLIRVTRNPDSYSFDLYYWVCYPDDLFIMKHLAHLFDL